MKITDAASVSATSNASTANANAAPSVTILPISDTMDVNQSAMFIATASGGSSTFMSYQWYVDGSLAQSGAASALPFTPRSSGSYLITVAVTDSLGVTSAQSTATSVTVNATPTVSVAPVGSLTLTVGQVQVFTASASDGSGALSYQWYLDGVVVGSNSASYTYIATVGSHSVTCLVTDSASVPVISPASNTVTLTVNPAPTSTPTPTPTTTPTPTPTASPSPTPSPTPMPTATSTPTPIPTPTPITNPKATPTPEPTVTHVSTPTPMPAPSATTLNPTTSSNLTLTQSSIPQGAIYGIVVAVVIVIMVAAVLVLRKSKKGKS